MGPEVLLKGQNGLPNGGTLLAHDRKPLAIGERSPYLLENIRTGAMGKGWKIFFSQ